MRSALMDVHTAIPGEVTRYDAALQLCDVKPQVKAPVVQPDGSTEYESLPIVTNVPVVFPGAGGFRMTFPVQNGDTVLLIFSEASIDRWLEAGGDVEPGDTRRHHLADAIAVPGLHPKSKSWTGAEPGVVTIGSDVGPADFVALATKVATELNALKTAFNTWVPVPNDGGAALKAILTTLFSTWPGSVASGTVKIKG